MNIKNTIIFAAYVGGLLMYLNAETSAQQKFVPPGSYQKSCQNISTSGATLDASCNPKGDGAGMKILKTIGSGGDDLRVTSPINDYFECDGDIRNDDGQLKCNRNPNSALMKKAKPVMEIVYRDIYGGELDKVPYESGYQYLLREMFKAGLAPDFYAGTLNQAAVTPRIHTIFLNNLGKRPEVKAKVIDEAFTAVYSTTAGSSETAFYMAQKISYEDIVNAEKKKLAANQILYTIAINQATQRAFGRTATADEHFYWMQKGKDYKEMIAAMRQYLHTPEGAKELADTAVRDLKAHGIQNPTSDQITKKIIEFRTTRKIFDEM